MWEYRVMPLGEMYYDLDDLEGLRRAMGEMGDQGFELAGVISR
jgi:hypothetical protein